MSFIRITAYPNKLEKVIKVNKSKLFDLQNRVLFAGEMSANYMRDCIVQNTKRRPSTGELANSIRVSVEDSQTMYKVSVGKLEELPIYWYVINYGKKLDGTMFIPGGGKRVRGDFGGEKPDSAYQGTPGGAGVRMNHPGSFGVTAKLSVYPGMGFVEKTKNWLLTNFTSLLSGV